MEPEFFQILKNELKTPLPGKDAHINMLPKGRILIESPEFKKNAAVSIIMYPSNTGDVEIIFIKRAEYDGHHSGQISFPGGKEEKDDKNLLTTAIRECYEEIGVKLTENNLVGELTPVYVMVSEFMIYPFVFYYQSEPVIEIAISEVSYTIKFPIHKLLNNNIRSEKIMNLFGHDIEVPYYNIMNEIVWGATAMILSELIEILEIIKIKNPGILITRDQ
jgi:8-oxo-dGTP pyrophosphatase MutT (NUDIX family)